MGYQRVTPGVLQSDDLDAILSAISGSTVEDVPGGLAPNPGTPADSTPKREGIDRESEALAQVKDMQGIGALPTSQKKSAAPASQPAQKKRITPADLLAGDGEYRAREQARMEAVAGRRRGGEQAFAAGAGLGAIFGAMVAPSTGNSQDVYGNISPALTAVRTAVTMGMKRDEQDRQEYESALKDYHTAVYRAATLNMAQDRFDQNAEIQRERNRIMGEKNRVSGAKVLKTQTDYSTGHVYYYTQREDGSFGWQQAMDENGKPVIARPRPPGQGGLSFEEREELQRNQLDMERWKEYGDRNRDYEKERSKMAADLRAVEEEIAKQKKVAAGADNSAATWGLPDDPKNDSAMDRGRRTKLKQLFERRAQLGNSLRTLKASWDKDKASVEKETSRKPKLWQDGAAAKDEFWR